MALDQSHIHKVGDGHGLREVFVDGVKVEKVFFADTKKGYADCYVEPLKLHKYKKRALTKRVRGHVTVNFITEQKNGS